MCTKYLIMAILAHTIYYSRHISSTHFYLYNGLHLVIGRIIFLDDRLFLLRQNGNNLYSAISFNSKQSRYLPNLLTIEHTKLLITLITLFKGGSKDIFKNFCSEDIAISLFYDVSIGKKKFLLYIFT